ncbi:MAG TPA: ribosome maturation factor RimM [Candidatus Polarisedimenticolia bacterium]|nr:ribosome maturation factor RimM [Candidatus Polarisedimenticolia bacterium]
MATGLRLRGAGGRLTAHLVAGGVDQFRVGTPLQVGRPGGPVAEYVVEESTIYGGKVVLKLRGIDSAAQAEALVGQDILMPCNRLVDLPEGTYYIFELVGLKVRTSAGRCLGTVRDVLTTGGTPVLAIEPETPPRGRAAAEILLPAARSICRIIDPAGGSIVVEPPEGLLDIYDV